MKVLYYGRLEELQKLVDNMKEPTIYLLSDLLSKGPMNSAFLSSITGLDEEKIIQVLDKLCEEGLVECIEKDQLKVYVSKYTAEVGELEEFDDLAQKIGYEFKSLLYKLVKEHDEVVVKAFEKRKGEYSLGNLVMQLTIKSLAFFFDEIRKELMDEAKSIIDALSKQNP
jgi:predicted transcriptional regulator